VRYRITRRAALATLLVAGVLRAAEPSAIPPPEAEAPSVIIVVGVAGAEEYGESFLRQATEWEDAATRGGARQVTIGLDEDSTVPDRDLLKEALATEPRDGRSALWLVLIGHGTFDGDEAKFNTRGDDFSAAELGEWLKPIRRPMAILNTASSSAPFMAKLAGPDRVIVTATRSGYEQNYARFGIYLADAIGSLDGDLDKDGQTSLLEAFLSGAANLAEWYKTEGRLATEHPLIDDNGDGMGTPPDWFRGVRAVRRAANNASTDGVRAQQFTLIESELEKQLSPEIRERRDQIEQQVATLRDRKDSLPEEEYFQRLEGMMLELARLYFPDK